MTDLNSEDKMNFHAAEKMCSSDVIKLLGNIECGEGTATYLEIMQNVLSAYLNKTLNLQQRVYKLWFSVYILRFWRYAIQKSDYTLQNNFITYNSYMCIELNAIALLKLIKEF